MSSSAPGIFHRVFDAIDALDHRVVYTVLAVLLAAPFIVGHWNVKWGARQVTKRLYDTVEQCADTGKPVLLINAWIMDSRGENQPQFEVLVDHMMRRRVKFILLSLEPDTAIVGRSICLKTERYYKEKFGEDYIQYGRDWLDLGYQLVYRSGGWPIWVPNIKADGLVRTLGTDYDKRDLTLFPIMRRPGAFPLEQPGTPVDLSKLSANDYKRQWLRLDDFGLILEVHFVGTIVELIGLVRLDPDFRGPDGKPKIEMGEGTVNMLISELLPFYDSGSLAGILAGYQGAAEYAELLRSEYGPGPSAEGFRQRSNSYSLGVLWVLALIVIGNISTLRKVLRNRRLARGGDE